MLYKLNWAQNSLVWIANEALTCLRWWWILSTCWSAASDQRRKSCTSGVGLLSNHGGVGTVYPSGCTKPDAVWWESRNSVGSGSSPSLHRSCSIPYGGRFLNTGTNLECIRQGSIPTRFDCFSGILMAALLKLRYPKHLAIFGCLDWCSHLAKWLGFDTFIYWHLFQSTAWKQSSDLYKA